LNWDRDLGKPREEVDHQEQNHRVVEEIVDMDLDSAERVAVAAENPAEIGCC
jgi:hypothetical protein